ncbi:MAG: DUF3987 domain-containing protein [Bacteroidetes bacterium]|nr:DUF3987 domain-containing protein [Bacteroidota bacterium]
MDNQNKTPASLCNSQPKDTKYNQLPIDFDEKKTGICNISPTEMCEDIKEKITSFSEVEERQNNRFPVDVFPLPFQQIIMATNKDLSFPIDFVGASMLYVSSIAIGNTFRVEVKKGWSESAVLYLAIVARSGTNKSHPLNFIVRPIVDHDKKTYRKYEQLSKEYENAIRLSKKEREQQAIDEPTKPFWEKIILTDFTPEALAEVHKFSKRGIGVKVDELAGWIKNFNRYNKGSEMEFWLSQWNGEPINIDRKTGEPIFIPLPFISVAGTIQTGLLNDLAKDNRNLNGFIDRILFVFLNNLKKPYWSETDLDPKIILLWNEIVSRLLSINVEYDETFNPKPELLFFSPEAKQLLYNWQKSNADQCNEAENEIIAGIYSKIEIYVVRFALILELMRWACHESDKQSVGLEAVNGAIKLAEYFKNSAIKVNSIISNANPLDKLTADKKRLYEVLPDTFTTETGLLVAKGLNVPERSFKRFLNEKELFNHVKRGEYEKRI